MNIVALSDTHGLHREITLPKGEVLVYAGDFSRFGTHYELEEFMSWLEEQDFKKILVVPGNHDHQLMKMWPNVYRSIGGNKIKVLIDDVCVYRGVVFYGTPWMVMYNDWAFMLPDLVHKYAKIPDNTDVLITHGPPFGVLDKGQMGVHCGSRALMDRVSDLPRLKAHFFGHIHEGFGEEHIHYNVSILNEKYEITNKPTIVRIS